MRGEQTRSLETGAGRGLFIRLRPGVYAVATEWRAATALERHRAAMEALQATSVRKPVFSYESAATLHGIPVIGGWPVTPHIIAPETSRRTPRGVVAHRPRRRPEIGEVDRFHTTTLRDTAIALAASRSLAAVPPSTTCSPQDACEMTSP